MMRKFVCVVIVVFLTAISCANGEPSSKEYEIAAPKVIVSNTVPCLGEEVQFYYQSDISGVPLWDFGDGSTSDDVVTKHVYMEEQVYTVTLTLSDGTGGKAIVHTTVEVAGKSLIVELKRLATNPSEVWFSAHRANTYDGKKVSNTPELAGNIEESHRRRCKFCRNRYTYHVRWAFCNYA
jgi:PKD repeat protein